MKGYVNIYRSGHWHRAGKPGAYDRHGGDVYASWVEARNNVDPWSHFVATVEVEWVEVEEPVVNPSDYVAPWSILPNG